MKTTVSMMKKKQSVGFFFPKIRKFDVEGSGLGIYGERAENYFKEIFISPSRPEIIVRK